MTAMHKDNERIFIITVGLVISVLGGVYLYTQNTGINACLNAQSQGKGYKSWSDLKKRGTFDKSTSGRKREILNKAMQTKFNVSRICTEL